MAMSGTLVPRTPLRPRLQYAGCQSPRDATCPTPPQARSHSPRCAAVATSARVSPPRATASAYSVPAASALLAPVMLGQAPAQQPSASLDSPELASLGAKLCEQDGRLAECRDSPSTKWSRPGCWPAASPATKASKEFETSRPRQRAAASLRRRRQLRTSTRHETPSTHFASAPSSSLPPRTSSESTRDGATADESPLPTHCRRQRSEFFADGQVSNCWPFQ